MGHPGAMSMPQCSIQACVNCMKMDKLCVGPNTIFQMRVSASAPWFLHPGDAPQTSERPRQGFTGSLPGSDFGLTWSYVVRSAKLLVRCSSAAHACAMFCVNEATAAAIRQAFETS